MTTQVAQCGPYREIVEVRGFLKGGRYVGFAYLLSCGHEVERAQSNRGGAYCDVCTGDGGGR